MVFAPLTPRRGSGTWNRRNGSARPAESAGVLETAVALVVWGATFALTAPILISCHLTSLFVTAFTEPSIWNDTQDTESPFGAGTISLWSRKEDRP